MKRSRQLLKAETGPLLNKAVHKQSVPERLCDALAILALEPFRGYRAALNDAYATKDGARVLSIRAEVASALEQGQAREFLVAFQEIAQLVHDCERDEWSSPLRAEIRQILWKVDGAADRVARVLEENEQAAAITLHIERITQTRWMLENVGGSARGMADNDNIPLKESMRAFQIVFGRFDPLLKMREMGAIDQPNIGTDLKHGRTAVEIELALRLAIKEWTDRQQATRANCAKQEVRIRQIYEDVEFLIEALGGRPGKFEARQILRDIRAKWLPSGTDIISSRGMRALSEGIRNYIERYLPPHRGRQKFTGALGAQNGRQFCAVAASHLFEVRRGWKPAHDNPEAQRLCAVIWRIAGFGVLLGRHGTGKGDLGWDDPLRLRWVDRRFYKLLDSPRRISEILWRHGIVGEHRAAE